MQSIFHSVELAAAPLQHMLLCTFLLSLRVTPVLMFTPVLQAFGVPVIVRVLLVVGLCAAIAMGADASVLPSQVAPGAGELVLAALKELALGFTLALSVIVAFAAISMAGRLCDVQIGFGIAQVFDPTTRRQVSVLQAAFEKLGVIVFFLVDGHHALVRGLAYSIERFPIGRSWPLDAAAPQVIKQVAGLFGLGLALAAPVVVCLLMAELALGVLARTLPQMNMFVVGVPVKIIVGLSVLSLWLGGAGDAMNRVYGSVYRTWDAMFSAAPVSGNR